MILNGKQIVAARLLGEGVKASEVAKRLGIRNATISLWKKNEEFQQLVREYAEKYAEKVAQEIKK